MSVWLLRFDGFRPEQEKIRQTLCTVGNGSFATREATSESHAGGVLFKNVFFADKTCGGSTHGKRRIGIVSEKMRIRGCRTRKKISSGSGAGT